MTDPKIGWSEADSKLYQEIAPIAVPARTEQIAALLTLLPFGPRDLLRVVEVGCGEGLLSFALLNCFPQAEVVALDGSPEMRKRATERLTPFGSRVNVASFNLTITTWFEYLQGADCVVSSLCLHHLPSGEKQRLFAAIYERLSPRGALLLADLIEPQRPEARRLFASTWDRAAEAQSVIETGSKNLFDKFVASEWNYYRFDDPADHPSTLFDQLTWLKAAGFSGVDCFWLQAGHAIYGGYKTQSESDSEGYITFETAWRAAQTALNGQ